MIVWIILAGVAVLLIAVYGTIWYLGKKRAQALQALAAALSFTFTAKGNAVLVGELSEFHLFSQGYRRRISNVLQGKFNLVPVTVMDYKYTTGGGKSAHTWVQTVLVFESDKLQLPRFVLRRFRKIRNRKEVYAFCYLLWFLRWLKSRVPRI